MADPKDVERAHNQGQQDESEGRIDPVDALTRAIAYSQEEKDAYSQGRESVRRQREENE